LQVLISVKNILFLNKIWRSYDVLRRSSEMKKRSTVVKRKHHARTMSWDAVLKWKENLLLSKENITFVRCFKTQFWDEKKIYCCRKKTSRSYDVLRRSSEMKRRFIVVERNIAIVWCLKTQFWNEKRFTVVERKHHVRTMFWDAVLRWKEDLLLSKETLRSYDVLKCSFEMKRRIYCCRKNIAIVRCLEMQFWDEKKNLLLSKKTLRSYVVLKCSFKMKKKIYCCRRKHHARTMFWNAILKWKEKFIVVEKNSAIVRCLETQFWNEKKNLLLLKEIMRSYNVLKRSFEMKRRIYCCRKKHCDRTISWNAILKWKEEFIVVEKKITLVRCLEMQFWNEKKNLLLSKKTMRSYDVLIRNSEMKRRFIVVERKHHVRIKFWNVILKWIAFIDINKIYYRRKKTSRSYEILR
jgi:uncharacterized pyridoxamine 5'-phosphate oxidase family protein